MISQNVTQPAPAASGLTAVRRDASAGVRRTDSLVQIARARTTDPDWVTGAKPAAFCRWLFDLLGARSGDTFVDLFPGSGGVARAWHSFATTDAASARLLTQGPPQ